MAEFDNVGDKVEEYVDKMALLGQALYSLARAELRTVSLRLCGKTRPCHNERADNEIGHRAQAAADQALNLLRASRLPALGCLASHPRVGRTRQHSIFGGQPTLPFASAK